MEEENGRNKMEEENVKGEPFRAPSMFSEHETWRKLTRNVKLFKS